MDIITNYQLPRLQLPSATADGGQAITKIKKGFTLIEILIVISIMAILVTILTSSFSQAQKQGRDAKRRGDMKSIQNAFEQYRVVNGRYPKKGPEGGLNFQNGTLPADPRNTATYFYKYTWDTTTPGGAIYYCACALLENSGKGNATDNVCTLGTGDYLCVKNLQ